MTFPFDSPQSNPPAANEEEQRDAVRELLRIWDSDAQEDWQPGVLTAAVEHLRRVPCSEPCCVERRDRADAWAMLTELYRVLVHVGAGSSEKRHRYSRSPSKAEVR